MDPIRYSYPEPPLPAELQAEIEASVGRFKEFFPAFFRHLAEDYVPQYRAEITSLIRKSRYGIPTARDPRMVLGEQSEISRQMHEETGAPVINVPIPCGHEQLDMDGRCRLCGADRRGIYDPARARRSSI